jgi:hypothetical protein
MKNKVVFILLLVLPVQTLFGQNLLPELNDHVFVPIPGTKLTEPVTSVDLQVGFDESDEIEIPIIELDSGNVVGLQGDLIFVNVAVNTSIRVKEWISFRFAYGLSTRIGTDVQSLLSQGFTKLDRFEANWQIRLLQRQKFMLSTIVGFNRFEVEFLDVVGYVDDLLNGIEGTSLNNKEKALTGEVGLLASYAPTNWLGFYSEFTFESGESLRDGTFKGYWGVDLVGDINFNRVFNVPVGLAFRFSTNNLPEFVISERRRVEGFGYRIAYTGSDEFSIGISFSQSRLPLPDVPRKARTNGARISGVFFF